MFAVDCHSDILLPATLEIHHMILRKLADAIRQQNWFTVVLEILIVVIGILIGLQVDGWNERRATAQLYRAALNAFLVESTSNRELLDERIRRIE